MHVLLILNRFKNIEAKEEIASYLQILLFPQCFKILSGIDASKCASWDRVNPLLHMLLLDSFTMKVFNE